MIPELILWVFQIIAFLCAVFFWNTCKHTTQNYFAWFLAYVLITECVGYLGSKEGFSNYIVYNVFTIISGFFYLFWFRRIFKQKQIQNLQIIVFAISIIVSLIFENIFNELFATALITLCILILINVISYYSQLLNSKHVLKFQYKQEFWICTGLLIFYLGFLPLLLFKDRLNEILDLYNIALTIINAFMFGFFAISFICIQKK